MKIVRILKTCAAGVFLSALITTYAYADRPVASSTDQTIASGVHVEGVDLSGMSLEEASAALQNKVNEMASTAITLNMGENVITTSLADMGYSCTNLDIVNRLTGIGKSGNIVERYKLQKDLENNNVDYPLEFTVDEEKVRTFVSGCNAYNTDPVEGQLLIGSDGYPYVEGGTDGITLKEEESDRKSVV